MATFTNFLGSGLQASLGLNEIREDLIDEITNVDPTDTPLFSMASNVRAKGVFHEWPMDALAAASGSGATEGSTFSGAALTRPTRGNNWCQILRKDFAVTLTEEEVVKAGIDSMLAFQRVKAMKELARNTEVALIQNTATSIDPRQLGGIATFITTNTQLSGAATLTQANFHALQELVFNQSGVNPDLCLLHPRHKMHVSTWYSSVTREMGNLSQSLGVAITEVITDFGPMRFAMERYVATFPFSATQPATGYEGYLLPLQLVRKAWLCPTRSFELAQDGDLLPAMLHHELTLEVLAQKACGRFRAGTTAPTYPT